MKILKVYWAFSVPFFSRFAQRQTILDAVEAVGTGYGTLWSAPLFLRCSQQQRSLAEDSSLISSSSRCCPLKSNTVRLLCVLLVKCMRFFISFSTFYVRFSLLKFVALSYFLKSIARSCSLFSKFMRSSPRGSLAFRSTLIYVEFCL